MECSFRTLRKVLKLKAWWFKMQVMIEKSKDWKLCEKKVWTWKEMSFWSEHSSGIWLGVSFCIDDAEGDTTVWEGVPGREKCWHDALEQQGWTLKSLKKVWMMQTWELEVVWTDLQTLYTRESRGSKLTLRGLPQREEELQRVRNGLHDSLVVQLQVWKKFGWRSDVNIRTRSYVQKNLQTLYTRESRSPKLTLRGLPQREEEVTQCEKSLHDSLGVKSWTLKSCLKSRWKIW